MVEILINWLKTSAGTDLCRSACGPGVCLQDRQPCRRRAGGAAPPGAAARPPPSHSGGSLRPAAPRRPGRTGGSLEAGRGLRKGEIQRSWGWGGVLTVAGAVLGVEPLPTRVHTLALVQEQPAGTGGALGHRGTPAGGAGAVAGWERRVGGGGEKEELSHLTFDLHNPTRSNIPRHLLWASW